MQNRYTGDIGDFGKLGLLRQLSRAGLSIGVNWYLTPDETHNEDGRHVEYLQKSDFCNCDESLWYTLKQIVTPGWHRVYALELSKLLQAKYYSNSLDFTGPRKKMRSSIRQEWRNQLPHSKAFPHTVGVGLKFNTTSWRDYCFLANPRHAKTVDTSVRQWFPANGSSISLLSSWQAILL